MQYGDSWIIEKDCLLSDHGRENQAEPNMIPQNCGSGFATVRILRRFAAEYRMSMSQQLLDKALDR